MVRKMNLSKNITKKMPNMSDKWKKTKGKICRKSGWFFCQIKLMYIINIIY